MNVMDELRSVFTSCCQRTFILTPVLSDKIQCWWEQIQSHYQEPRRHYHTLDHVEHLVSLWKEVKDELKEPNIVLLAIFFHDVIYDPLAKDNEKRSADLFMDFSVDMEAEKSEAAKVYTMIMLTENHVTEAHRCEDAHTDDSHLFLDMDMSVLGSNCDSYDNYARQIRLEYNHIPLSEYCLKRSKVLQSFIETPFIFATQYFRRRFEDQARLNLRREINSLEKENIL